MLMNNQSNKFIPIGPLKHGYLKRLTIHGGKDARFYILKTECMTISDDVFIIDFSRIMERIRDAEECRVERICNSKECHKKSTFLEFFTYAMCAIFGVEWWRVNGNGNVISTLIGFYFLMMSMNDFDKGITDKTLTGLNLEDRNLEPSITPLLSIEYGELRPEIKFEFEWVK